MCTYAIIVEKDRTSSHLELLELFPPIQTQQPSYCTFHMEQMALKSDPHTSKESLAEYIGEHGRKQHRHR